MYTYDDVLDALHDLELKNPNVLLNIPENKEIGKKTHFQKTTFLVHQTQLNTHTTKHPEIAFSDVDKMETT